MKLKYIIASLLAGVTLFSACEKEADHYLSEIKVDKSFVGFPKEGGSQTIVLTATDAWTIEISEDDAAWLSASPASGTAGTQNVTLTAVAGEDGHDTSINIVCAGQKQIVKVSQEAGEKKEPAITPIADAIAAGAGSFRLQGLVTKVANTDYGNFYIEDETGSIYIYGVKDAKGYPKDDASGWARFGIEVGDKVVVEGPFKLYGDTPELVDAEVISVTKSLIDVAAFDFDKLPCIDTTFNMVVKAKESPLLLSSDASWLEIAGVNADGSYKLHARENVVTADRTANIFIQGPTAKKSVAITQSGIPVTGSSVSEIIAMEDGSKVQTLPTSVVSAVTSKGCVLTDGVKAIYVYNEILSVMDLGDGVQLNGTKTTYNGVPEITDVTFVLEDSAGNPVNYPEAKDITAQAGEYAATEAEYVKLSGTLSVSGNYYNILLDAFPDGSKQGSIVAPAESLNAGSFDGKKITVTGYFNGISGQGKYINVIATKIVEFVDNPKGTATNPYMASEIATLLANGTTFDENVYVKGVISQKTTYNYGGEKQYNTASFWISDDGKANGVAEDGKTTTEPTKDFECYGVFWLGGSLEDPTAGADIKANFEVGDEVVVYGAVTWYANSGVAETSNKKAKIYSLNRATTDENGVGNASYPFNTAGAKAFIDLKVAEEAAAKAADAPAPVFPNVCVKGKINEVVYTYNADKGTCTFWMSDDGSAKDFEAYSLYYFDNKAWVEGNKQIAVGDEVIVKGQLTKYNTTYETSSKKAWLYSLNGATE